MARCLVVLVLAVLAGCARTGPPAPYRLYTDDRGSAVSAPVGPHPDRVVVANGETLYGISRRYGLPVRAIIDANGLQPPYRLTTGTSLALPQVRTHMVHTGDTLALVARRYGVDISTLAAANHISPPYVIRTGETLILPAPVETGATAPPRAAPVESVATSALSPPSAISGENPQAAAPTPLNLTGPSPALAQKAVVAPSTVEAAPAATPFESKAPAAASTAMTQTKAPVPAAAIPSLPVFPVVGKGFLWPVHGRVIGAFGTTPDGTHNDGINILAPEGTPVLAAEAGEVAYAGNELKGYGNLILVKHPDGFITAYAHNSALLVKRGDKVLRGQPIARLGATGAVSEPQLHFEIRRGTQAVDPSDYLPAEAASAAK
jgi:murein DD-endopeptidase MepM/ murein hydrolase activator NlpD